MLFAGKMGFEEFGHVSVWGFCLCPRIECKWLFICPLYSSWADLSSSLRCFLAVIIICRAYIIWIVIAYPNVMGFRSSDIWWSCILHNIFHALMNYKAICAGFWRGRAISVGTMTLVVDHLRMGNMVLGVQCTKLYLEIHWWAGNVLVLKEGATSKEGVQMLPWTLGCWVKKNSLCMCWQAGH